MNKLQKIRRMAVIVAVIFAAFSTSCKKESVVPNNNDTRINGVWSHTRIVSSSLTILTQLEFKSDGTGTEKIFRITPSGGDTPEISPFSWSTRDNNQQLTILYFDVLNNVFSYGFSDNNQRLVLKNVFGTEFEYFITE